MSEKQLGPLDADERQRLAAVQETASTESLYEEAESLRRKAFALGQQSGRMTADKRGDVQIALAIAAVVLTVIGLIVKAQVNNVNQGRRELRACASGWTAECMEAVYRSDSERATLYTNVYHQQTGRTLPAPDGSGTTNVDTGEYNKLVRKAGLYDKEHPDP